VALRPTLAFRQQIHLDVRDVRPVAHEVVPHQSVEIKRRRRAGVDLVIGDFRLGAHGGGNLARGLRGAFERAALGQVQDDLKLALVVERQHFHLHPAERDERHRAEQQRDDRSQEKPPPPGLGDHRSHHPAIQPREEILFVREVAGGLGGCGALGEFGIFFPPAQDADRSPRRDNERDGQRPAHRGAGADRNRAHVRPHQPADEGHRQHRGDDGERREDRRVSDLAHGFDRDVRPIPAPIGREVEMPDDIFDHDDRVVDEDADREDQREKRDAIQREAEQVENQQRQRERGRNGEGDDGRFAPAKREPDQRRNADDREAHMEQEFVRFLRGGLAVVARDGNVHIARDDGTLERFDFAQHLPSDGNRIRSGALRDAERDGGFFTRRRGARCAKAEKSVIGRLLRAIHDGRDFAQIHGPPAKDADDHAAHLLRAGEEAAGFDDDFLVVRREAA